MLTLKIVVYAIELITQLTSNLLPQEDSSTEKDLLTGSRDGDTIVGSPSDVPVGRAQTRFEPLALGVSEANFPPPFDESMVLSLGTTASNLSTDNFTLGEVVIFAANGAISDQVTDFAIGSTSF